MRHVSKLIHIFLFLRHADLREYRYFKLIKIYFSVSHYFLLRKNHVFNLVSIICNLFRTFSRTNLLSVLGLAKPDGDLVLLKDPLTADLRDDKLPGFEDDVDRLGILLGVPSSEIDMQNSLN